MNRRLIVLGLLIICIAADAAAMYPQRYHKVICPTKKIYGCTKIMRPVCGTDGVTYANKCLLCKEMYETKRRIYVVKEGRC